MKKFSIGILFLCLFLTIGYYYSAGPTMKRIESLQTADNASVSADTASKKDDAYAAETVDTQAAKTVDASSETLRSGYYICYKDGQVVVCEADKETIFEYTDIVYDGLPKDLKEEIAEGKYIKDLKTLYGFLENYSS